MEVFSKAIFLQYKFHRIESRTTDTVQIYIFHFLPPAVALVITKKVNHLQPRHCFSCFHLYCNHLSYLHFPCLLCGSTGFS